MKSKKPFIPAPTVAYAYVGMWRDEPSLGWHGASHLNPTLGKKDVALPPPGWYDNAYIGEKAYLCRVEVTPVLNSRGRPKTLTMTAKGRWK